MFTFKVKKLDNFKFSYSELVEYYKQIREHHQHLKWEPPTTFGIKLHSWAIQTKMKDPALPCPAYHLPGESAESFTGDFDTPTELVFGFGKRIIDTLPGVKQMTIIVHAPGTVLPFHKDEEEELEEHWKIHIPIETNERSLFQYEDEEFVLAAGHAYLVNTSLTHGTDNRGLTERSHLIFKVPSARVEEILNSEFNL